MTALHSSGDAEHIGIAGIGMKAVAKGMGSGEIRSQHGTAVLNHAARPQQQRTDCADILLAHAAQHLAKPLVVGGFHVVIEQTKEIALGIAQRRCC